MSDEKDAEIARLTRERDEARASEARLRTTLKWLLQVIDHETNAANGVTDPTGVASEASLRKALEECTDAMQRWGAEEDGLPGDQVGAYQAYVRAMQLLPDNSACRKGGVYTGDQDCANCFNLSCGDNANNAARAALKGGE